jgi:hypothetical protein
MNKNFFFIFILVAIVINAPLGFNWKRNVIPGRITSSVSQASVSDISSIILHQLNPAH